MYKLLSVCSLCLVLWNLQGQTIASDTTVYQFVDEQARFPGCEHLDTTQEGKQACAEQRLLQFISRAVLYPAEARQNNIQGTAVVSFIVEPDGQISRPQVIRDPGSGLGTAALGVLLYMQQENIRWRPGHKNGKAVRSTFNLPVRFRLEEPLPYTLIDGDTLYTTLNKSAAFIGGQEALSHILNQNIVYPDSGLDSCRLGSIDLQLQIKPDGSAHIMDMTDFNDLGFDFWYSAIHAALSTSGQWEAAEYEGRKVSSVHQVNINFRPDAATCQSVVNAYQMAVESAAQGQELYDAGNIEEGLAKMSAAVLAFPRDAGFLMQRGQAYLNQNRFSEACEDLRNARELTAVGWFDGILSLICR